MVGKRKAQGEGHAITSQVYEPARLTFIITTGHRGF